MEGLGASFIVETRFNEAGAIMPRSGSPTHT